MLKLWSSLAFLLQEQEDFHNPHRQHDDVRSPLIYSDPSRSGCSAISITAVKEEIHQKTDCTCVIPVSSVNISTLVQFSTKVGKDCNMLDCVILF